MKSVTIQYWPTVNYLLAIANENIAIEQHENYQKKSFRNKANIINKTGILTLSVPLLKGKHGNVPITAVEIAYYEDWITQHLKSIQMAYENAPYFIYYFDKIKAIYASKPATLWELNVAIYAWIISEFKLPIELKFTETFSKLSARNTKSILSNEIPMYRQANEQYLGFLSDNVSCLDLIMNVGVEIPTYLK